MNAQRIFPSTFDPEDTAMTGFTRPIDWQWVSAQTTIRSFGAAGIMMRLPLFWQLEAPLFEAAQRAGAFIFVNDAANMPLGASAIRTAGVSHVVTTASDSAEFSAYLRQHSVPMPSWFIVHPLEGAPPTLSPLLMRERVCQEVHIAPGMPALVQCEELMGYAPRFHISDDLEGTRVAERVHVSAVEPDHAHIVQKELPFALQDAGTCACGKAIYVA